MRAILIFNFQKDVEDTSLNRAEDLVKFHQSAEKIKDCSTDYAREISRCKDQTKKELRNQQRVLRAAKADGKNILKFAEKLQKYSEQYQQFDKRIQKQIQACEKEYDKFEKIIEKKLKSLKDFSAEEGEGSSMPLKLKKIPQFLK